MPRAPSRRFWRPGRVALAVCLVIVAIAGVLSAFVTVGYVAISPGGLHETERLITVEGAESFTSEGEVLYATVSVREVTFWGWLEAKLDDDIRLLPTEQVYGDGGRDENRQNNLRLMDTSKIVASALALERVGQLDEATGAVITLVEAGGAGADAGLVTGEVVLAVAGEATESTDAVADAIDGARGGSVELELENGLGDRRTVMVEVPSQGGIGVELDDIPGPASDGALVAGLVPGEAADEVLDFGDVIIEIEGEMITTTRDALRLIRARDPGDELAMQVKSTDGSIRDETAVLGVRPDDPRTPEDDSGGPFLGIEVRPGYELPIDVEIDSGNVGGPSAGLAFTLATIDLLTEGELTGGTRVAATGEILDDGSVGVVGGVAQKAVSAREAGVELFLVPIADAESAQVAVGDDVLIVAVATLDDALAALAELGGNAGDFVAPSETVAV